MKKLTLLIVLLSSSCAFAEVYEVIDKNGKKTYTDKPPLNQPDSKPVNVAPRTSNTWKSDSTAESNNAYFDELKRKQNEQSTQAQIEEDKKSDQDAAHQAAVESAEKALEDAREAKAGDYYRNRNGGIHYNQEYLDRVKSAEDNLQQARDKSNKP